MQIRYPQNISTRRPAAAAAPWIERLARIGYAAKGVVFLLVGGLAVLSAVGRGGDTTDTRGALTSLSGSQAGTVLLILTAVGLAGYVLWQIVRVVRNPENDGAGKRVFFALVGVIYTSLAVEAVRLAVGSSTGGSSDGARHWSATVMEQPLGRWLLMAAGIGIGIYGLQQLIHAWRVKLDDQLDLADVSSRARTWVIVAGRAGLAARGVVFVIIGAYVVLAGLRASASEARGLDGVLDMLAGTPWLPFIIAAGLAAYGVYNLVRARYRTIRAG